MANKKKDDTIKNALILMAITLIAGFLLGLVYEVTKEPIAKQKEIATNNALKAVLESAESFEKIEDKNTEDAIKDIYAAKARDEVIGYAFLVSAKGGYGGDVEVMVGLDTKDGEVNGIDVLKHNETPGLGAKSDEPEFKDQFKDKPLADLKVVKGESSADDEIAAISGATITSRCVTGGVDECIVYLNENLEGGK